MDAFQGRPTELIKGGELLKSLLELEKRWESSAHITPSSKSGRIRGEDECCYRIGRRIRLSIHTLVTHFGKSHPSKGRFLRYLPMTLILNGRPGNTTRPASGSASRCRNRAPCRPRWTRSSIPLEGCAAPSAWILEMHLGGRLPVGARARFH